MSGEVRVPEGVEEANDAFPFTCWLSGVVSLG